jgi:hypothetical protein
VASIRPRRRCGASSRWLQALPASRGSQEGVICMHCTMKYCKPADGTRQISPLVNKPPCDKPRAFAPPTSERYPCSDRCSQVWQRCIHYINKKDGDASDTHSNSSAASDSRLRRRYRTMNTLYHFDVGIGDETYVTIIGDPDDPTIRAFGDEGQT